LNLLPSSIKSSSNDEIFNEIRGRSAPIPDSLTTIPSYPLKLKIFQTRASKFWQVRCYVEDKYIVRSLRTINKQEAITLAKKFYESEILKIYSDSAGNDFRVMHGLERVSNILKANEIARANKGEISFITVKVINSLLNKHILKYFKNKSIELINDEQIFKYYEHLRSQNLRPVSIAQNLTTLKKLFSIALTNKWIKECPAFPKVKKTSIPRGGFSVKEYLTILRACSNLRKTAEREKVVSYKTTRGGIFSKGEPLPFEFKWLIRFMVNSFVRPVDIKIIQHQHIQIIRGKYSYLRITLPETKSHTGQIITLPAAVHIYEKLKEYFKARGYDKPADYLFMPEIKNRQAAISLMDGHFRRLLEYCDLRYGVRGQVRTLYSLRHTSITFRLLYGEGIDLLTLAKNARTSVEMIEKHYASELSAELNVDMLHSRRHQHRD